MSQTIDLGKVVPVKGVDYWTPSEAAEVEAAKKAANDAAAAAQTAKTETEKATTAANNAAKAANDAAGSVDESKAKAEAAARHADDSATNADRAAADANREMAEYTRQEQTRQQNEETRKGNETTRVQNENTRKIQESARVDAEKKRVTDFNTSQTQRQQTFEQSEASRAAEFNRTQQEKQAIFDSKEAARDEANRYALAVKADVDYLLHLFGQYATPAPQSLVIDPTRKDVAISAESMSEVSAEGWAISQPIVIRKGNIYRIKVGEASGQYVTTAMRYQYRDEQGNLRYAYKRKTQLDEHSELPVDGYLIMYGLPRDYELVVCFKYTADYDPVVEVLTAGLLRTLAFQLGDMQDMIDQKLDVNGHSSAASVGGAMALLQKGDVPEDTYSELLTARMIGNAPDLMHVHGSTDTRSGIDDGKDVNVVVEKVWGDVIGGNQMADMSTPRIFQGGNVIVTKNSNTKWTIESKYAGAGGDAVMVYTAATSIKDHKGLILFRYENLTNPALFPTQEGISVMQTYDKPKDGGSYYGRVLTLLGSSSGVGLKNGGTKVVGDKWVFENVAFLDLTTLFPTDPDFVDDLKQNDAIKVAHRLGFSAFTLD